jgi:hypothetical protein
LSIISNSSLLHSKLFLLSLVFLWPFCAFTYIFLFLGSLNSLCFF